MRASFTIIAFPVPEIGDQFEEIFKETMKVNTLDNEKYIKIQQINRYTYSIGSGKVCESKRKKRE